MALAAVEPAERHSRLDHYQRHPGRLAWRRRGILPQTASFYACWACRSTCAGWSSTTCIPWTGTTGAPCSSSRAASSTSRARSSACRGSFRGSQRRRRGDHSWTAVPPARLFPPGEPSRSARGSPRRPPTGARAGAFRHPARHHCRNAVTTMSRILIAEDGRSPLRHVRSRAHHGRSRGQDRGRRQ